MKKMYASVAALAALTMAMAVGALFVAGCEQGDGTTALVVQPSAVDFTSASASNIMQQTFVATNGTRTLSLPLEWSVSNPGLGTITSAGGFSATYTRFEVQGDNTILVKDQYGAQGVAAVHQ
jgi:hypothetical protein